MRMMQVLGLTTLLGTGAAGCADSRNSGEIYDIVKYQPDITTTQFEQIKRKTYFNVLHGCENNEFWQQQADKVIIGEQVEAIYKAGFEDAKAGKFALSGREIKVKMLELFDNAFKVALENAKKAK